MGDNPLNLWGRVSEAKPLAFTKRVMSRDRVGIIASRDLLLLTISSYGLGTEAERVKFQVNRLG